MPFEQNPPSLDRRHLLGVSLGLGAGLGVGVAGAAARDRAPATSRPQARTRPHTSIEATSLGVVPDAPNDVTARLQRAIDHAAEARAALVLAPGRYVVSGLRLHSGTILEGVAGATRLEQGGGQPILTAQDVSDTTVSGLTLVGRMAMRPGALGLLEVRAGRRVSISNMTVEASAAAGIYLEKCSGVVSGCQVTFAATAGIWSMDAEGLDITLNAVTDCDNNGILVWSSKPREDATIVSNNRIQRIAAKAGGSGQNGNGINIYRAGNVIVAANRISDCAYSAVRANSASGVQIQANSISRMGEVAIYSEFAFEGAVISANQIDGAATGISVTNFNDGGRLSVVQGNLVRNLVRRADSKFTTGYGIVVEADAAVTGNVIEAASTAGIAIGWGRYRRDVVATGNVIRQSEVGIGVSSDEHGGAVLIASNMISGARDGAIRALDHGKPVGRDLGREPQSPSGVIVSGNSVA